MARTFVAYTLMCTTALGFSATSAFAAEDETSAANANTEIIVTAEKRSEALSTVPLAVTAFRAEDLRQAGVTDTADLSRIVPGFSYQNTYYANPVYYIRGVGFSNPTPTVAPAVSVYLDQVPLPFSIMARGAVLDLQQVEVLKGPQGTLFGQNSTGGAVNYIPAKPTDTFKTGLDVSYGRFNSLDVNGYVSGPLTSTLGYRLAGQVQTQSDWQYSTTRNDTRGQKKFLNGRLILDWKPSDRVKFELTGAAWHDTSDSLAPQYYFAFPKQPGTPIDAIYAAEPIVTDPRAANWDPNSPKARNASFRQIALNGSIELSDTIRLASITSYSKLTSYQPSDLDGTAYTDVFGEENARIESFSQELRLEGKVGRLAWMIGGNYQHDKTTDVFNNKVTGSGTGGGAAFDAVVLISNNPSINTYAVFGSAKYDLTDALTVRGSVRYTDVKIRNEGCLADADGTIAALLSGLSSAVSGSPTTIARGACATLDVATFKPLGLYKQTLAEDNVSWRIGLDWNVAPGTMVYANVAKGYKAGAFTALPAILSNQLAPVRQESLMAYEAGVKSALLDRRLYLDASVFYYDYKDKQLNGFVRNPIFLTLPTLITIPKARVYGAEASLTARVTPLLKATFSGSYISTKVLADPVDPVAPLSPNSAVTFVGESFPYTSKYQFNADIEQTIPISGSTEGYIGGNVGYRSSTSSSFSRDTSALARKYFTIPSYAVLDLRAGLKFDNGTKGIELWARNVTDKYYLVMAEYSSDTGIRSAGAPRSYGVRLFLRM